MCFIHNFFNGKSLQNRLPYIDKTEAKMTMLIDKNDTDSDMTMPVGQHDRQEVSFYSRISKAKKIATLEQTSLQGLLE